MIQAGLVAAYWEVPDRERLRSAAALEPLLTDLFDCQEEGLYGHLLTWGIVPIRVHHFLPAAPGVLGVLLGATYPETWCFLLRGLTLRLNRPVALPPLGEVRLRRIAADPRHHPHIRQLEDESFYSPFPLSEPVFLRTWSPLKVSRGILGSLQDLQQELAERFDNPDLLPRGPLGDWTLSDVRLKRNEEGNLRGCFSLAGSHPYAAAILDFVRINGLGEKIKYGLGAIDTPLPDKGRRI
jgi:hypothetical protein